MHICKVVCRGGEVGDAQLLAGIDGGERDELAEPEAPGVGDDRGGDGGLSPAGTARACRRSIVGRPEGSALREVKPSW